MNRIGWMIAILCLSLAGCAQSGDGSSSSSRTGSGTPPPTSGPSGASGDTGGSRSDGGTTLLPDGGSSGASDAGAGAACAPDIIPLPTAPGCAASTRTCIGACTDQTCFDNCLEMDPDADGCYLCLDDAYLACVNAAGCQAQWDAVSCCLDTCGETEECYTTTCGSESTAFEACATPASESCGAAFDRCFAS